jgi:hypothetical protein
MNSVSSICRLKKLVDREPMDHVYLQKPVLTNGSQFIKSKILTARGWLSGKSLSLNVS